MRTKGLIDKPSLGTVISVAVRKWTTRKPAMPIQKVVITNDSGSHVVVSKRSQPRND